MFLPGGVNPWWLVPLAYVVGATPFGFLAGKLRGVDIRQHGSGNIGATNVIRTLGKGVGIPVFVLDVLKGLVPVWLACSAAGGAPERAGGYAFLPAAVALAAILGHSFTFWLGFRGGKGVATAAGALLAMAPVPLLCAAAVWAALFATTRYVAVASIGAAWALPLAFAAFMAARGQTDWPGLGFCLFVACFVTFRHRANIARLRAGTENRFQRKRKPTGPGGSGET
jgi:glycerol-3-phosphate acyltransferase PlsY